MSEDKKKMKFMDGVIKKLAKNDIHAGAAQPPSFWVSTGNYALNKIISGAFRRGIPQGRITAIAGPSGAGKSFNVAYIFREAQSAECYVVVLDSENALDDDFVQKLGVNTDPAGYTYVPVNLVSECKKTVAAVITGYKADYGAMPLEEQPRMLIAIDSLNMLMTDTEEEQFNKGESRGDMGQKNKQLKAMLQAFTNAIKRTNILIVVTSQVYENQDFPRNGKPLYIFPAAVEYCCSQIIMVTKLKLKDKTSNLINGVRMKCEGSKTRFCKPFSTITMLVPYEEGMNPYSGLLDIAEDAGIVTRNGAWYTVVSSGIKFQEKTFDNVASDVLDECDALALSHLKAKIGDDEFEEGIDPSLSMKQQRKEKFDGDQLLLED